MSRRRREQAPAPRRVALAFSQSDGQLARLRRGILKYAQEHPGFSFLYNLDPQLNTLSHLPEWDGDGAIVHRGSVGQGPVIGRVKCPVVVYGGAIGESPYPRVRPDFFMEGELAAGHLLERGFTSFGFLGQARVWFSLERLRGFGERLREAGMVCVAHLQRPARNLGQHEKGDAGLREWLRDLAHPAGVMVDHDLRAVAVYEACMSLGLRIPEDVAVIGVDNDPMVVTALDPMLTSLEIPFDRLGYEALRLLHRIMDGDESAPHEIVLPAGQVVERGSTEIIVSDNPALSEVLNYLRENLHEAFGIKEVVERLGVSRRWLERELRARLGRSPGGLLMGMRVSRVKGLLEENPQRMAEELADLAGFFSERQMREGFRKVEGMSLEQFRRGGGGK